MKKDGNKVAGHRGKWYVIQEVQFEKAGTLYHLEHEIYGEDAHSLLVDKEGKLLLEDISDREDIEDYADENGDTILGWNAFTEG